MVLAASFIRVVIMTRC